jgi:hypothetical protein
MPITLINPGGFPTVDLYRQVSVASGSKLVVIVDWTPDKMPAVIG